MALQAAHNVEVGDYYFGEKNYKASLLRYQEALAEKPSDLARGVLLVFSLCALADFLWALLEKRSLAEAIISAVLGLFGTAWYLFMYWVAEKMKNDPDDPNWPARMVP
jgi:hypothetical protein